MNDFVSIFKKDILYIVDRMLDDLIINKSFNKLRISYDFVSKSRQGDISTNLLIILKNFLLNKNFDLNKYLHQEILNLKYVNKVDIVKAGFINVFFKEEFLIEKLNCVLIQYLILLS